MNPETDPETLRDDELLMAHAALHSYYRELSLDRQVDGWDRESIISAHADVVRELENRNLNHEESDELDETMNQSITQFAEDILSKNERSTGTETNTTRKAIIATIANSENSTLAERDIIETVDEDPRTVKATLQGLDREGVLSRRSLLQDNYFTLSPDAKVRQAIDGTSPSELAEQALQDSTVLGPHGGRESDDLDRLMRELF